MSNNKAGNIFKLYPICLAISQSMGFNGFASVFLDTISIFTSVILPFDTVIHNLTLKKCPDEPGE